MTHPCLAAARFALPALLLLAAPASAQGLPDSFVTGPRIEGYGPAAPVDQDNPVEAGEEFRHSFDISAGSEPGELNRGLVTAARFLNMHAASGARDQDVTVALVVHGDALASLLKTDSYASRFDGLDNPNAPLVAALIAESISIQVCGQSAESQGFAREEFLPGVEMALSAMTAHARLQRDGYTLNPF
ncbi:hypothetical protein B5C34_05640 [Pacificimonas flava]|uniref:Uncharacterized protein n=2 Tax=Pacificimonas TaxID=1960290 RepID=A0A219B4D0_9SPHN|nr:MULTISPECIES: DsrE family protein [Pacificimonas]MBZ6377296.1 DsrE family protein [Pacificimonas aurantium]OWV32993.1 hypothetical protein B5C34_05640 [Pacificimonas flava]